MTGCDLNLLFNITYTCNNILLTCQPHAFSSLVQVPRFLTGLRAVRPLIRIGSAAGSLVAIPLELLRSRGFPRLSEGSPRGPQPRMASLSVSWQLQRSFVGELPCTCGTLVSRCLIRQQAIRHHTSGCAAPAFHRQAGFCLRFCTSWARC